MMTVLIVLTMTTMMTTKTDIIHITITIIVIDPQENIMTVNVTEAIGEDIVVTEMAMETTDVHPQEATAALEMEMVAMTEATALHMAVQDTGGAIMVEAGIIEEAIMEEMVTMTMGNVLVQVIITAIIGAAPATETEMGMVMKVNNLQGTVLNPAIQTTMKMVQMIPLATAIVIPVHALARKDQDEQGADHVLTMTPGKNSSGWMARLIR